MKRITKHLMTLLLSVVMVMAMGLTAFAADTTSTTYKLTLTGTATGHTYEAYQIFTGDLSTKEDGTKVLSNVKWGTGSPIPAQSPQRMSQKRLATGR